MCVDRGAVKDGAWVASLDHCQLRPAARDGGAAVSGRSVSGEEIGPGQAVPALSGGGLRMRTGIRFAGLFFRARYDSCPVGGVGRQHTVIAHQVEAPWWYQGGQFLDQFRTDRSTESLRLQPDEAASSLSVPGSDSQGKRAGCPASLPVSALPVNEETARPIPRRSVDVAPVPAVAPAPIARRLQDPSPPQSPFDCLPSSCHHLLFAYLDIRPSTYADNARLNEL